MNAVAKVAEQLPETVVSANAMMEFIQRAAADPAFDVAKLERMMALAERMEAKQAERAFDDAMATAQEEMAPVRTDAANKATSSRYATYAALDRAIRPTYTKHGFSVSYDTGDGAPAGDLRVLAYVAHRGGCRRTYKIDMPADGKGAKGGDVMTRTHATGSAFSYGKRYSLGGIFNIVVSDADDDGNSAGGLDGPITAEQLETLQEVIARTKSDPELVSKHFKVEALKDLTKRQLPRVIEAINSQPTKKA